MSNGLRLALSVEALEPRLTGIGRYCLELARRMPLEPGMEDVRFFRGKHWVTDPEALLAEHWRPTRVRRWRSTIEAWRHRRFAAGAVVHGPNFFLPEWAERGVATVHDLSVFHFPETHPVERVRAFERDFLRSIGQASAIITDCATVKDELVAMFGVAADRITAVPLGVTPPTIAPEAVADSLAGMGLAGMGSTEGGYALCVSTFEPRKRIDLLLAAYARLEPALRRRTPLVLAGASGWRNEALNAAIAVAQAEGWVRRLDYVPEGQLQALYAGARLFVYPSQYEGFGLPPLEAMAHGVPTLVGNSACLAEVTRGAARVIDPRDEAGFAEALASALEDEAWQAEAGAAGRAVAAGYGWPECIARTISVYETTI
ncbi:glycosyltransferase WbpY [Polymorphobacter multimanifer]|uniref:Alpha-1,3-rhamnosyl/mannosyltransferase n=1 Tax=Polymorphobacter multimanifer TaxID=1070431 RepID=A0A841L4L8_9SPHN|nr:glycosyltransferase family 1 protein [Polymorphobacter multimanifer]MBB6227799.1 alpha-1,3-rhamnosyl/mannosyltransferase [Polymorphobacter multimanifer]GGI78838.1 glycosyltransferase WbpY [Polymorphobacter multimanifer]